MVPQLGTKADIARSICAATFPCVFRRLSSNARGQEVRGFPGVETSCDQTAFQSTNTRRTDCPAQRSGNGDPRCHHCDGAVFRSRDHRTDSAGYLAQFRAGASGRTASTHAYPARVGCRERGCHRLRAHICDRKPACHPARATGRGFAAIPVHDKRKDPVISRHHRRSRHARTGVRHAEGPEQGIGQAQGGGESALGATGASPKRRHPNPFLSKSFSPTRARCRVCRALFRRCFIPWRQRASSSFLSYSFCFSARIFVIV